MGRHADKARSTYFDDPFVTNEEYGRLVEEADAQDQREETEREVTEQPCGCPIEYHLADCDGRRAPTKDDILERYGHLDVDDWPDSYD